MKFPGAFKIIPATALFAGVLGAVPARATPVLQQVKTVFVIAMENHNFRQPSPLTSPQQIFTNPAAPYINSLITAGNPNAAPVSYATKYYNAGAGVHPSEPSYVWAEGGTDFGVHTDNDPSAASANVFTNNHLARQLNTAGIAWKNYQEDVELHRQPNEQRVRLERRHKSVLRHGSIQLWREAQPDGVLYRHADSKHQSR